MRINDEHKKIIECDNECIYIGTYQNNDIMLFNLKLKPKNKVYIRVFHKYCNKYFDTRLDRFKSGERPYSSIKSSNKCCCKSYENSFAHHIEVELGLNIDDVWDFKLNKSNPYHIYKNSNTEDIWLKCENKKQYPNSYKTTPSHYTLYKRRCPYCSHKGGKVHLYDSFGYKHFDKVCMNWSNKNEKSPFKINCGDNRKYEFVCTDCNRNFTKIINNITKEERNKEWCSYCALSNGERKIENWLRLNNIEFTYEKMFFGLIGINGGNLSYDFYLPNYNLLIEYQGEFHDNNVRYKKDYDFEKQKEHDKRKREYARLHGINLLEIWYYEFNDIEEILSEVVK
jgi:DNA-directed RNA polymerase subunit RPC12/RpoP